MRSTLVDLEKQARQLSLEERAQLALVLLDSLEPADEGEIEAAWRTEIEARLAAYDRGEISAIPAADVFAEARRISR